MSIDFSYIDSFSRDMIIDGYKAVDSVEGGWDFLKTFVPEEGKGFMFTEHEMITKITNKMEIGHSGSSFGWTMRQLEFIAKKGMDAYKLIWIDQSDDHTDD